MSARRRKGLTATRPELAVVLGISSRTVERLTAAKVLQPIGRPRRGTPSRYDVAAAVRAFLAYKLEPLQRDQSARDRYQMALAELRELDLAERSGELVPAGDVLDRWLEHAHATREAVLEIPRAAVQSGVIPATAEAALDDLVRDVLTVLAKATTREQEAAA